MSQPETNAVNRQAWNAQLYEDKHSFVWKHGAALLELLDPQAGQNILDLGCGTGELTAQIEAAGATVLGIDSSPDMIAAARRNFPDLRFDVTDARSLPFAGQFDAVFSNAVLHWVPEAVQAVQGIARALKPGGKFVAEFGGKGNVQAIVAAAQRALRALNCPAVDLPWYFPSVAEYSHLLEQAGLEVSYAALFDRPTPLEGESGMRDWITMFGGCFLNAVMQGQRAEFLQHVEDELRPVLGRDAAWIADYRRLRVVATLSPPTQSGPSMGQGM